MGKYYRMQSPIRTAFWFLIISLLVISPGLDISLLEAIIISGMGYIVPSEVWISAPIILTLFIFMIILKKKYPRAVTIVGNSLMIVQISLYMIHLSYFSTQIINIFLTGDYESINLRIGLNGSIGILLFFTAFRLISKLRKSFADCEPESDTQILFLWILIILIHILCIVLPINTFMANPPDAIGLTGYLAMISLMYYIFPIIFMVKMVFSAIATIKEFRRNSRKGSLGLNNAIIVVIFVFSLFPLIGHIADQGENERDHSIYNFNWSGNSEFREMVNESMGYDVYSIQSSLSALLRMNRSVCLVIMGPTTYYNPLADIPFFLEMFKDPNFSMLICDDHGSTSSLLLDLNLGSSTSGGEKVPLALFTKGILYDNASYLRSPDFPIISDFESHETTAGISKVVLSKAGALLGGDLLAISNWKVVGRTSAQYSWVDVDNNGYYTPENDNFQIPQVVTTLVANLLGVNFGDGGIPLGGYPQVTFAHNEMENGNRLFLTTDASMFNNELMYEFDNKQFGENIINWLTRGNDDIAIVFDESHNEIRGKREFSSAAMFGLIQGYVNWLSTNPFLSWIYPLYALRTISKRLPKNKDKKKKKKKEEKQAEEEMEELKFRTSSFFAKKINWYRINKKYNQALTLLSKRLNRKILARMGGISPTVDNIIEQIQTEKGKYVSAENVNRIKKFLIKLDEIKNNEITIVDEEEFNDMFFEMSWMAENI